MQPNNSSQQIEGRVLPEQNSMSRTSINSTQNNQIPSTQMQPHQSGETNERSDRNCLSSLTGKLADFIRQKIQR